VSMELRYRYQLDEHQQEIQQLLDKYSYLVEYVVARIMVDLPPSVEREDLIAEGRLGLIDAFNRFDPERHVKFETYASIRIRGQIVDYLRKLDWSPRSLRRKARQVGEAELELQQKLGRPPKDEEIAEHLGMSLADYRKLLSEISSLTVIGFSDLETEEGSMIEPVAEDADPALEVARNDLRRCLKLAIERLDERKKLVLECYYNRGMSLKEIGKMLGLTESRICQIHAAALARLREELRAFIEEGIF